MKNIIFDFDGTIGNTQKLIVKTLQDTMRSMHLEIRSEKDCIGTIGLRLDEAFLKLFPISQEFAAKCADTYRQIFEVNKLKIEVEPFPHVIETIQALYEDAFTLTIASSRGHQSIQYYLEQMGIDKYITCIVGAEDVQHVKPAPDMVFRILEKIKGNASESLVVGDTAYDIKMGKNSGTKTCGVTYGNGTYEQLSDADFVIGDFAELLSIVRHTYKKQ